METGVNYQSFNFMTIHCPGWGGGSESDHLYQTHLELLNQNYCEQVFDEPPARFFDPNLQICAGDPVNGDRGACYVSYHNGKFITCPI